MFLKHYAPDATKPGKCYSKHKYHYVTMLQGHRCWNLILAKNGVFFLNILLSFVDLFVLVSTEGIDRFR